MDGLKEALALAEVKRLAIEQARAAGADMCVIPELDQVLTLDRATGQYELQCLKCLAHRYIAEGKLERPNYSFQFTNPDVVLEWDVKRAWELVEASGRGPHRLDPRWLREWIDKRSNLTPGHMAHVPAERLGDPVLVDMIATGRDDNGRSGPLVSFPMLIVGHHRVARALQEGRPIYGFMLTTDEHNEVVTRHDGAFDSELVGWRTRDEVIAAERKA